MPSTRQKKKTKPKTAPTGAVPTTSTEGIQSRRTRPGVCAPCKAAKQRCEFRSDEAICQRCEERGIDARCIIPSSRKGSKVPGFRSGGMPTSEDFEDENSTEASIPMKPATSRKRSHSGNSRHGPTPQNNRPTKQRRLVSDIHVGLDPILEANEDIASQADTLVAGTDGFAVTINKPGYMDESEDNEDGISEGDDVLVEEVEISSDSEDEDTVDDSSINNSMMDFLSESPAVMKQSKSYTKGKSTNAESTNPKAGRTAKPNPKGPAYNPQTCPFTISGVVRRSDGLNAPVTVQSGITLDNLRALVAEKLDRFPNSVALQYRLSTDSTKAGPVSIQTENELQLFKDRMRGMIVPPLLANGKPSNRVMKPVLVYFEDSGSSNEPNKAVTNNGGSKKNTSNSSTCQSIPAFAAGNSGLNQRKAHIIEQLQERWKCSKHGRDKDVYCYSPGGNVCQTLTIGNLSYWALEIMEGRTTIEEKPATLYLTQARPPSRATTPNSFDQMGFSGPVMQSGLYGYPPGPAIMPMWNYPVHGPNAFLQGGQHFGAPTLTINPASISGNSSTSGKSSTSEATTSMANIPDIITWFSYLDQHEERNKDNIVFAPYGMTLKANGFLRLSQLMFPYVQREDLQTWLGIDVGTAILIMQYAKEDLDAIKAGKLIIPHSSS